jgi:hypothetical protein
MNKTALMEALGRVLEEFMEKQLIMAPVAAEIARLAAEELEGQFDQEPILDTQLDFDYGDGIANYRFDEGRWELIVRGPLELSVVGGTESVSLETGLLGIEGNGPGLNRGASKGGTKGRGRKRKIQEAEEDVDEDF